MIAGTGRPPARGTKRRARSDRMWGGSRDDTNRAIEHIDAIREPNPAVTSRKRLTAFGNPSSDHWVANRTADAVDFGLNSDQRAATRLAHALGWDGKGEFPSFGSFTVKHRPSGQWYRIQIIWTTHGTGPHLHCGVKRV